MQQISFPFLPSSSSKNRRKSPAIALPDSNTVEAIKKSHMRHEFVLSANLPPGYSASGVLANPKFLLCHLREPHTNRFHVSRANPLCLEVEDNNGTESNSPWPTSNSSEDDSERTSKAASLHKQSQNLEQDEEDEEEEEKARRKFLSHSVELAAENSRKMMKELSQQQKADTKEDFSVEFSPAHTFRSVIA